MSNVVQQANIGKKIFFVNPTFFVRTRILSALREQEYETYIFTDYKRIKGYLRVHKNAIVYINPEMQLSSVS